VNTMVAMVGAVVTAVVLLGVVIARALGPRGRRLVFRWFAGEPMTGRRYRTDATFLRAGTQNRHTAPVRRWSYLPGWQRSAARQGGLLALVAVVVGLALKPVLTLLTLALTAFAGVFVAVWAVVRAWHLRRHRQEVIEPLHAVMVETLKLPEVTRPESYLKIPLDYDSNEEAAARIELPVTLALTSQNKTMLKEVVLPRLGFSDSTADVSWPERGKPWMKIKIAPQPPKLVPFKDIVSEIEKNETGTLILGLDKRRNVRRGDFRVDDPHWGGSVGSRRGKSTFLQVSAMQLKVQDPLNVKATFIDVKRTSFPAMVGIPGFTVLNDPRNLEAMWEGIADFRAEMDRRMDATDKDRTLEWPGMFLFLDEVNQFSAMTKSLWKKVKEKGDPNIAPVWEDVAAVVWQGAQFNCHLIVMGQRLDDQAFGGNGLRDSLGFRALGGYRPQQWAMLIGTTPIPRSQKGRGRWIYSDGEDQFWVQNIWATDDEIRDYIMKAVVKAREEEQKNLENKITGEWVEGPVTVTVTDSATQNVASDQRGQSVTGDSVTDSVTASGGPGGGQGTPTYGSPSEGPTGPENGGNWGERGRPEWMDITPRAPRPEVKLYTLAEAARDEIVPLSYEALRQAKKRDGDDFPEGIMVGKRRKWTAEELQEWVQERLAEAITDNPDGE
jgi:hypothetical protein